MTMASLTLTRSQISFPLEACTSSNKNNNKRPCIARLYGNKTHFINLVAKPTLLPNLRKKCSIDKWKARGSDDGSCGVAPEFLPNPSAVHIVHEFYEAFNKKDTETLKQLLSPNCVYQDLLFYTAYEGQESIISFWESVMNAMGPNIHVFVEDVKESNNVMMVTAFMHLEWKDKKLPFTNGCRFFTFEEVEGKMLISKITSVEEFPLKPGELVLVI
ncbi:nuclear transport factor 2 family protein [Trifolium pratense]|uniref:Nuclear transport factor 2 family protein n=2 Tax=Trifolium pratense TaxID=57577 RepID=A0A2K3LHI4_TRIPR|nr:nuclear transport factor 2 family protein [Trifolium pratense]PNX77990.1 nuclear transport factor 2 family protein [Trifolium pratense]